MDTILGLVRHAGNDGLFKAVEMSLLATLAGHPFHIHAEGLRGTGKTTVMRAVRRALPRIRRVRGCIYNCDPASPHCPEHRHSTREQVSALGEEWVPMPFLEISHSAKVGTVVGSIDLGRLVSPTAPEAALLPGSIPQAHRGIIFVDEINRLAETAPELADVLLDVMGTKPGRVQIEETGLKGVELPVQVSVWAASNPDEDPGPLEEIRRQLSDRFDLAVYTDRPTDVGAVERILADVENQAWHRPLSPTVEMQAELYRTRLDSHSGRLGSVALPQELRHRIADLYSLFSLESLRAIQAIQLGMRLAACLDNRAEPGLDDLAYVTHLALRHRVDPETHKKVSAYLAQLQPREGQAAPPPTKARFSPLSFGQAQQPEATPQANVGAAAAPVERRESAPLRPASSDQAISRQASAPAEPPPDSGWLNRTLSGLRRNLGMQTPGGHGAGTPSQGLRPAAPNPTQPPQPGRFFQQVGREGGGSAAPGARQGSPSDAAHGPHQSGAATEPRRSGQPSSSAGDSPKAPHMRPGAMPFGPAQQQHPGAALPGGAPTMPGAALSQVDPARSAQPRQQAERGAGNQSIPDPLFMQTTAPPHRARPLSNLAEDELIRTEEELDRS